MGNNFNASNKVRNSFKGKIINQKEFSILKNDKIYKIIIIPINNIIKIKCMNFERIINVEDFYKIFNIKYNSIEEIYNFIINIFNTKQPTIKDSAINNNLILVLIIFDNKLNINKEIELILFNKYELNLFDKIPEKIHFCNNLSKKAYNCYSVDNTFIIFKGINEITYLVYASEDVSIICYSLNNDQLISEISDAHEKEYITNLNHLYNKRINKDIIMSVSGDNNNIKIWDFYNWECILNLKNINQIGFLESACVLNIENDIFIISSNWNYEEAKNESIKVFDFKGNKIKEIINSKEKTYYVNTFYEYENSTLYITSGNFNFIKSYDYKKNKLYKKYFEKYKTGAHISTIIYHNKDITELIESCVDGFIRFWNFHTGKFLYKIDTSSDNFIGIFGICLWNKKYLFAGCNNSEIKLIDLEKKTIIKKLNGHKKVITCIKKIIHPKFGECLISQAYKNDQLKLWII